jgi:hypothetical protein
MLCPPFALFIITSFSSLHVDISSLNQVSTMIDIHSLSGWGVQFGAKLNLTGSFSLLIMIWAGPPNHYTSTSGRSKSGLHLSPEACINLDQGNVLAFIFIAGAIDCSTTMSRQVWGELWSLPVRCNLSTACSMSTPTLEMKAKTSLLDRRTVLPLTRRCLRRITLFITLLIFMSLKICVSMIFHLWVVEESCNYVPNLAAALRFDLSPEGAMHHFISMDLERN